MSNDSDGGSPVADRWLAGVAAGAGAFAAGYACVVALNVALSSQSGPLVGVLEKLAVLFYNAHAVPAVGGGESFNFVLAARDPNVPVAAYVGSPVVALVAVGTAFGAQSLGGDPRDVLHAGASLAVGYAALAVLGALAVSVRTSAGTPVSPDLAKAAVFGLAYPVVFGTLGAGAGFAWRRRA